MHSQADEQPLVSILVAFYNNVDHVEEAIKSACAQTYENIEIIVVDDCSPDPAAKNVIRKLQVEYNFQLVEKSENQGASKAYQTAFEHSKGSYISILSHDDVYSEDKIESCLREIQAHNLDAVYCNGAIFYDDIKDCKPFDSEDVVVAFKQGQEKVAALIQSTDEVGSLLTQGALYSRRIMKELSWIRERFLLDDWPFTIKVWRDYKVGYKDEVVYYYRIHSENTHKNYWKWFPARIQTIAELIPEEDRLETLAFMLGSMSRAERVSKKYDNSYRFAMAALMLSRSKDATPAFLKMVEKASKNIESDTVTSIKTKMNSVFHRSSVLFKCYSVLMKLCIGVIPSKAIRRKLRKNV